MNQPAKSHEPSMEEILASIRRIIADDDAKTATPAVSVAPAAAQPVTARAPSPMPVLPPSPTEFQPEVSPAALRPAPAAPDPAPVFEPAPADVLELTEEMRAPDPMPAAMPAAMPFTTVEAQPDVIFSDDAEQVLEPEPEPDLPELEPLVSGAQSPAEDTLEHARQTLSAQMETERPLLSQSATAAVDSAFASLAHTVLSQNARTLDDLVKEMLRPMLKAWLDDNLPSLVERLVRAEIERVSRGR